MVIFQPPNLTISTLRATLFFLNCRLCHQFRRHLPAQIHPIWKYKHVWGLSCIRTKKFWKLETKLQNLTSEKKLSSSKNRVFDAFFLENDYHRCISGAYWPWYARESLSWISWFDWYQKLWNPKFSDRHTPLSTFLNIERSSKRVFCESSDFEGGRKMSDKRFWPQNRFKPS